MVWHVSRLTSLVVLCLSALQLSSCRTQNNSGLEDAGVVGPNGEVALFFRDKADIVIRQCEDYTVLKTREDCKIKSGTKEARVPATDFKKHLLSIIRMSGGYGYPGFKEQIELSRAPEAAKQEELARQKAQLSAEIDKIETFIRAYGVENTDAAKTAALKKQLSDVEAQFNKNPKINKAVNSINGLVDKLVDELISNHPPASATSKITTATGSEEDRALEVVQALLRRQKITLVTSKDAFAFNVLKTYYAGVSTDVGEFKFIPSGSFMMGQPDSEKDSRCCDQGRPQHMVTISKGFFMGATEVTQSQWFNVMGDNASGFTRKEYCPDEHQIINGTQLCPNHPVNGVSWDDTQVFLAKLNKDGDRYRLPTEAEWEYAARAGTTTPFNLGENIDPTKVNYDGDHPYETAAKGLDRQHTVVVGSLKNANAWGLFDMHGNVLEWTQDWYGKYSPSAATDPKGPSSGTHRVARGGWFGSGASSVRSAERELSATDNGGWAFGFRLVKTNP